jgi:phospholipid/cholesterol/gamma-HCH transport system substrate-binding protein
MSRALRLGIFIVATLAILAVGVFIIGSKQYLFKPTYQLKAQFDNVEGLDQGGDVRLGGVHVGTVRTIVLPQKPGEKVTVLMDLDDSTHAIIKKNSVATIETEGLLGNQYMAISSGSPGNPDVHDGDTIASQPPLEMADLLDKASDLLDGSQKAIQNVTKASGNLESISAKIDRGQGTVGALVNDKQLYNNLENTTAALQKTMVQAQAGVTDFQENMEAMKHNFLLRGFFKARGYEDSTELAKYEVERLPQGAPMKEFAYPAKQLFAKQDSAKLKNEKTLNAGGEYLAKNNFGFAVVVVTAGMEGDAQKDLVLTEARAMVVREYLVEHYGFDDNDFRTLGLGKQPDEKSDKKGDWGTVKILIYPSGTEVPPSKAVQSSVSPQNNSDQQTQKPTEAAKPQ